MTSPDLHIEEGTQLRAAAMVPLEALSALLADNVAELKTIRRLMWKLLEETKQLRVDVQEGVRASTAGVEKADEVIEATDRLTKALDGHES